MPKPLLTFVACKLLVAVFQHVLFLVVFRRLEQALEEGEVLIRSVEEVGQPAPGHKHLGRQASFKKLERGLSVRVAMAEIQKAFDCVESASHVTTAVGGGLDERYDYMTSLFKHVDALATLLLFWKSKPPGLCTSLIRLYLQG